MINFETVCGMIIVGIIVFSHGVWLAMRRKIAEVRDEIAHQDEVIENLRFRVENQKKMIAALEEEVAYRGRLLEEAKRVDQHLANQALGLALGSGKTDPTDN